MTSTLARQLGVIYAAAFLVLALLIWARLEAEGTFRGSRELGATSERASAVADVVASAGEVRRGVLEHVISDASAQAALEADIDAAGTATSAGIEALEERAGRDADDVAQLASAWSAYTDLTRSETLPRSRAGDRDDAEATATSRGGPLFDDVLAAADDVEASIAAEREAALDAVEARFGRTRLAFFGIFLTLLAAGLWTWRFGRRLGRNLKGLTHAAEAVEGGDLGARAEVHSRDEVGRLATAFNSMASRLEDVGARQTTTTEALQDAVRRVAAFADRLARGDLTARIGADGNAGEGLATLFADLDAMAAELERLNAAVVGNAQDVRTTATQLLAVAQENLGASSEQAAAVTEVSATVEELGAAAGQAAARADELVDVAERARDVGEDGVEAVRATVDAMTAIAERTGTLVGDILALSEEVDEASAITSVVGELADRSNMLALNAGIEAAKAGEQGRGFAVVAHEVRSLAEQSKDAALQVSRILAAIGRRTSSTVLATEQSTAVVQRGRERAERAGAVIASLMGTIEDGTSSAALIAGTAREQRVAIDQIAQAIGDIGQASHRVASTARQTQDAVEALERLARELAEVVARYRTRVAA